MGSLEPLGSDQNPPACGQDLNPHGPGGDARMLTTQPFPPQSVHHTSIGASLSVLADEWVLVSVLANTVVLPHLQFLLLEAHEKLSE